MQPGPIIGIVFALLAIIVGNTLEGGHASSMLGGPAALIVLGGTIGETTMEVVGMPTFHEGQRSVLYVTSEAQSASPLVGFWHGRMRVERDINGVDRVRTYDGRSLGSPNEIGAQRPNYMWSVTPMRLADLEIAVKSRVLAGRPR